MFKLILLLDIRLLLILFITENLPEKFAFEKIELRKFSFSFLLCLEKFKLDIFSHFVFLLTNVYFLFCNFSFIIFFFFNDLESFICVFIST